MNLFNIVRHFSEFLSISGLNGRNLDVIPRTMQPSVSPEEAATSSVISNGGYDPCDMGVSGVHLEQLTVDRRAVLSSN